MSKIEVNQISSQCGSTLTVGQSGDSIQLACGATQTGFGRTGTVDWDTTAKTASFTAVSGNGYFVNTTSGAITVTLPAGSAGSIVSLKDYANTWQTNNVTVTPNGTDKINGVNANATLSTQDQSVTLVYVDSTKGWRAVQDSTSDVSGSAYITATGGTVTCCGDYKIHTFTSPGTFTVTGGGGSLAVVDYLVVAGGGGGGANNSGGGGGGGFRLSNSTCMPAPLTSPLANPTGIPVTIQGYPISVGGGGAGAPFPAGPNTAGDGSNSIFSTITSAGGGGGAPTSNSVGRPGGSGGGGRGSPSWPGTGFAGGTGNTPPVSPPQGNDGGRGADGNVAFTAGGGGGGAGAVGSDSGPSEGGNGGIGSYIASSGFAGCNGTPGPVCGAKYFSGGGGGSINLVNPATAGVGGIGGGGDGTDATQGAGGGTAGTANTGGGGGSENGTTCGNAGGSGIVIIRYKYQN